MSEKKLFSDRRWWEPMGMTEDGVIGAESWGICKYASEEERQEARGRNKEIREFLKNKQYKKS